MATEYIEYPSRVGGKPSFKLTHGGYAFTCHSRSKTAKYYTCDKRDCNASIIWRKGKWSHGRGWHPDGSHSDHKPDFERIVSEVSKGEVKRLVKTWKFLDALQQEQKTKKKRQSKMDESIISLCKNNNKSIKLANFVTWVSGLTSSCIPNLG